MHNQEEIPTVSDVIGDGADAHKVVRVGSWQFDVWVGRGEDEPRIRDTDLAERLRYERPRDIRALIGSLIRAEKINDVAVCGVAPQTKGGRPATEFWLTEAQALKVVAKSETEVADALLDEMIRVYILARRGLLPQAPTLDMAAIAAVVAQTVAAALPPIVELLRTELRAMAAGAGTVTGAQASEILSELRTVAQLAFAFGFASSARSERARLDMALRSFCGWHGSGRSWHGLPAALYAGAAARLREMRSAVEKAGEAARARAQTEIPFEAKH